MTEHVMVNSEGHDALHRELLCLLHASLRTLSASAEHPPRFCRPN